MVSISAHVAQISLFLHAQANCRSDQGQSLLAQWVTTMVGAYSAHVSWPLQTLKLDDQLAFAKVSGLSSFSAFVLRYCETSGTGRAGAR